MVHNKNKLESLSKNVKKPLLIMFVIFLFYSSFIYYANLIPSRIMTVGTVQNINTSVVGPLLKGIQIGQTFRCERNRLSGFSLLMATYARQNNSIINVGIREVGADSDIQTWQLNASKLEDNKYQDFILNQPVIAEGREFFFYLEAESTEESNAITIWRNSDDVYYNGNAWRNGEPEQGDLCFKTYLPGDSAQVLHQTIVKILIGLVFLLLCFAMIIVVSLKEPTLSLFDGVIRHRYFIVFGLFVFLVVFKLHGFSLGVWDTFIPGASSTTSVTHIWGKERPITSDVWGLTIPMLFNQVDSGFPLYNTRIMTNGANAVLYGLPVWDITGIGRPSLWGFLILGKEMGLSWFYWFRMLGLLMTSFEVGMFFTKGRKKISLMGAFVIVLSPLTQWWSGHILPELLLYAQMLLCGGLYYLLNWNNLKKKILAAVVFLVSIVSFVILFSPSLQVPLGYMVLIIAAGAIFEYREKIDFKKQDAFLIFSTIVIVGTILGRFFYISWGDIQLYTGTVFPGSRFETGGGYSLNMAFYHLFQWVLPFKATTWGNNCEVSTIIPFIPIVLLTLPILLELDKKRIVLNIGLYSYLLLCISWILFRYPAFVAKITLFANVPTTRLMWTIGVIGVYFGMICFAYILQYKPFSKKNAIIIASTIGSAFLLIIQNFTGSDYLGPYLLPSTFVTLSVYFIFHISYLLGYKCILTGILAAALLISGATVMPLNRGAGAIFDRPLSREISTINAENPDALWLYNMNYPMGNYLSAHGLKVFNVTNMYPDYKKWEKIDPTKQWQNIYNRYAQVSVALTKTKTSIELLSPDHIKATLTLANLHALKINYIVSPENIGYLNDGSLTEILYDDVSHIWIYRLSY